MIEAEGEEFGPNQISPHEHGRYHVGDSWMWTQETCWICAVPARPGEDEGSKIQLHEPACPTTPAEERPLACHELV
ncbi:MULTISPECIES: hypothetical protein [unclassified Crossiella]|uniref:hypothetical protein n=1 Tax=unclassified Crossiella TaxID=2620835 RepID=UPI001FFFB0EC|nr:MULTISPECIES: hypothetical protein [unclassified Crossiella]MCK2240049.1 hypothetical protein [Crossiella sp. S99.2]MCK2252757.1 hypothetical protein [Crossiella sp. S99.1]